ncbi:MAG: hypothetical protein LUD72_06935 [Bacteroidales bacterium]|nr:hypothetical protein [Bacteroidales bacterium]
MTAREYLSQLRRLSDQIEQKRGELADLHDIATAIGSFDYSKDRVQTSPPLDAPYTRTIERVAELDEELRRLIDAQHTILEQIQGLEDSRYSEVLYKRYAEFKSWKIIARELDYHPQYLYALHNDALKIFETSYSILLFSVL